VRVLVVASEAQELAQTISPTTTAWCPGTSNTGWPWLDSCSSTHTSSMVVVVVRHLSRCLVSRHLSRSGIHHPPPKQSPKPPW
jgi:hypothetical protein